MTREQMLEKIELAVKKVCSIYRTVGEALYDEPRTRLVEEIASALTTPQTPVGEGPLCNVEFCDPASPHPLTGAAMWMRIPAKSKVSRMDAEQFIADHAL